MVAKGLWKGEQMIKPNIKKAKEHLDKLYKLAKKETSPVHVSEEEMIKRIRKSREEIWSKKLAPCS
jgi:uncharacterized protein (DUF488 family)